MAPAREFPFHSQKCPRLRATNYWKTLIIFSAIALVAVVVPAAHAQLQQPLVFSSAGAVASRNESERETFSNPRYAGKSAASTKYIYLFNELNCGYKNEFGGPGTGLRRADQL